MIGATGSRPSMVARRRRLSRARRIDPTPRSAIRRGLSRVGFHGLVMAVGLATALSVWYAPRPGAESQPGAAEIAVEVGDEQTMPLAFNEQEMGNATFVQVSSGPAAEPFRPRVYTIVEGDTLRSIATEYSVSISTILASNKLDDPNMIQPGQAILIPPIEGVVADVKPNETLAQLAERFGVEVVDIAQANALPVDPETVVLYERIVVPGMETAERALGVAPRRQGATEKMVAREDGDPSFASKPSLMSYEVQDGDTVAQLATQFGVSVWTILTANDLSDADLIRPGMQLKVLPVNGVEHEVQPGESLSDIAAFYKVDLGPLLDFNAIADPDNLKVGAKLTIPGAERAQPGFSLGLPSPSTATASRAPVASAAAPSAATRGTTGVATAQRGAAPATVAQAPAAQAKPSIATAQATSAQVTSAQAAPKPQAPVAQAAVAQAAPKPQAPAAAAQTSSRVQAAAVSAPVAIASSGGSGGGVIGTAMKYLGSRYVFGGTSPSGFDCSGFVWYVHNTAGRPVSRALWGQLNGGPRIPVSALQPGDTVFFANTYMPGLSHDGIYIGGERFIHASDESSGVKISSMSDSYWGPRYVGASRLW